LKKWKKLGKNFINMNILEDVIEITKNNITNNFQKQAKKNKIIMRFPDLMKTKHIGIFMFYKIISVLLKRKK